MKSCIHFFFGEKIIGIVTCCQASNQAKINVLIARYQSATEAST